ncbi:MAG: 3D domain-containing protein [Elusimicrobiota bacterium]|jgi:3D (Asp-Asp-Asp) domain-containing protein|nr:3D domain-containing protein [Elusimicrobiota bacterium]
MMKNNILFQIAAKLFSIILFVYLLARALALFSAAGMFVYIDIGDEASYMSPVYKNVSLKRILDLNEIIIGAQDIVSQNINEPLKPFSNVEVTRVRREKRKESRSVPYRVIWSRQYDSNLRKVELQKVVEKHIAIEVLETFHNSVLHYSAVLNERSIAVEYYRLLLLSPDNKVEKIYDLSKAKRINMIATAYYPGDPLAWGDGTITFLGHRMQRGIVAVDPSVIPLRTRVFVSGYGYGYAGDTGNAIKGNRIDLGVNNAEEEKSWMFREVTVYILEPSNTW